MVKRHISDIYSLDLSTKFLDIANLIGIDFCWFSSTKKSGHPQNRDAPTNRVIISVLLSKP